MMKSNGSPRRASAVSAFALAAVFAGAARAGDVITVSYDAPHLDRWMYPFNATPGTRSLASTFGAFEEPDFDNRDGQFLLGFDTFDDVPVGLGADSYTILSAIVTVQFEGQNEIIYDDTQDPFTAFIPPEDREFVDDRDPGQPLELFGAGFRNDWLAETFLENSPHGDLGPGNRNAYALAFIDQGAAIDVSNSVRERFDPTVWAIGEIKGLAPGQIVPADAVYAFDLDLDDAGIHEYFQQAMDLGLLRLTITSHHIVGKMKGEFPTYYTKENPLVVVGLASAATLDLTVEINDQPMIPGDLDGDGVVGTSDLILLLGAWGDCPEGDCPADIDGDGFVGTGDLILLLGNWG